METPLAQFVDQRGRTWQLELNYSLAKRLREVTTLDFVNYHDGKALLAIHDSDERLVQVLWFMCETQARSLNIAEEEFGAALGGDSLEQALGALEQALLNFSRPARRQAICAIRDKAHELVAAQTDLTATKIRSEKVQQLMEAKIRQVSDQIDQEIDRQIEAQLQSTSGESATSAPGSSVSTPGPTPSAS